MSKKQALYKQMGLCRRCGKEPLPGKTRFLNCHQAKTLFGGCTEDDHESCKVSKDNELPLE